MKEILTGRKILRPFREDDYDDLFGFLAQLEDDEFEGYPGIRRENGLPLRKDTCVYALVDGGRPGRDLPAAPAPAGKG